MKFFYKIEGRNGATYIVNVKNLDSVSYSLKFYKARTVKQKVMRNALKFYLITFGLLCKFFPFCALKSQSDIQQYLKDLMDQTMNFELDGNFSVLVSPTHDKIIIHHHGKFFHKFAFGKSYTNVKNEAKIYELLNRPLQNFHVSKFYDHTDHENGSCSFKLSSQPGNVRTDKDLTLALVEMFNITKKEKYLFSTYLEDLKNRYKKSGIENTPIKSVLETFEDTYQNELISLGLVHRDFKPWNINDEQGLLIYDFEEAVTDGPPLEDLLNYHIDPIVSYASPLDVIEIIFMPENIKEYKRYLKNLEIDLDFKVLLYCYLIEKILFYKEAENDEIRNQYIELLKHLNEIENKKDLI